MKIAGSESASGSISQRHGSAASDPHQNVLDPQHRCKNFELCQSSNNKLTFCFGNITFKTCTKNSANDFAEHITISRNTAIDNNFAKHENTTSPLYWRRVPSHSSSHSRVMRRSSLIRIDTYVGGGEETTTFPSYFNLKTFLTHIFP